MHECMDDGDRVSVSLRDDDGDIIDVMPDRGYRGDSDIIDVMPDRGYRGDGDVNREDGVNVVNVQENNLMIDELWRM